MPAGKTHTEDRFEAAIEADLLALGGYVADDNPFANWLQQWNFWFPFIRCSKVREQNDVPTSQYLDSDLVETAMHASSSQPYEIRYEVWGENIFRQKTFISE